MNLSASAPGKLVLLGEYAVLFGAPALVMAVDRRAHVHLDARSAPGYTVHAPDVWAQPVLAQLAADGRVQWSDPAAAGALNLVATVLTGLQREGLLAAGAGADIRIETREFLWRDAGGTAKLGIGSSAAVTVALSGALLHWQGQHGLLQDRARLLRLLLDLHRRFQSGRGSGLDLGASLYGGVIRYTLHDPASSAPTAEAQPLAWPAALERIAVWSGRPASTARMLESLDGWRAREPENASLMIGRLCELAGLGARAVAADDAPALLACLSDYSDALQAFGEASNIPVFTPEHRRIRDVLHALGAVYKPCGAGGGDLGLAVADGAALSAAVVARLRDEQFPVVPLKTDPAGLRLDLRAAPFPH